MSDQDVINTSPYSPCDTGVRLVRSCSGIFQCLLSGKTPLRVRVQSRSLQRSVVTAKFMDEAAAAAEVLHEIFGLLVCSC